MTNPFNLDAQAGERIWITGDTVQLNATAAEAQGAYTIIEAFASPGNGPPPHVHKNEDETSYVLDGEFEILNGQLLMRAKPDALAFVPRGTVHRFRCVGDNPRSDLAHLYSCRYRGVLPRSREAGCRRWPSTTRGLSRNRPH